MSALNYITNNISYFLFLQVASHKNSDSLCLFFSSGKYCSISIALLESHHIYIYTRAVAIIIIIQLLDPTIIRPRVLHDALWPQCLRSCRMLGISTYVFSLFSRSPAGRNARKICDEFKNLVKCERIVRKVYAWNISHVSAKEFVDVLRIFVQSCRHCESNEIYGNTYFRMRDKSENWKLRAT